MTHNTQHATPHHTINLAGIGSILVCMIKPFQKQLEPALLKLINFSIQQAAYPDQMKLREAGPTKNRSNFGTFPKGGGGSWHNPK